MSALNKMGTIEHHEVSPALFVEGPISKPQLGRLMHPGTPHPNAGASVIFQGWVRADRIGNKTVGAIVYTAYCEMGEQRMAAIKEELLRSYPVTNVVVIHSIGEIRVGECCFFVRVTAPHRKAAFEACEVLVDRVKTELPIWGEELFQDGSARWKVNKKSI